MGEFGLDVVLMNWSSVLMMGEGEGEQYQVPACFCAVGGDYTLRSQHDEEFRL